MSHWLANPSAGQGWSAPVANQAQLSTSRVAVRPRAKKPARKPAARMATPSIAFQSPNKGISNSLVRRLGGVSRLFGTLNTQQNNAIKDMHRLLGENKFGGKDRTLNYGDGRAIVTSLLKDEDGLGKLASKRLRRKGRSIRAGLVDKAFSDEPGLFGGAVKKRVLETASSDIQQRMDGLLKRAKVDSKTSSYFDDHPRQLHFKDAAKFQRAFNVFRSMQRQTEKNLGVKLVFPKGLSQDFMQHLLDGRPGFPPNVSFRDAPRTPKK